MTCVVRKEITRQWVRFNSASSKQNNKTNNKTHPMVAPPSSGARTSSFLVFSDSVVARYSLAKVELYNFLHDTQEILINTIAIYHRLKHLNKQNSYVPRS